MLDIIPLDLHGMEGHINVSSALQRNLTAQTDHQAKPPSD
jgi:hypothetical protein